MLEWGIFFCLPLVLFKYLIKYNTFQNNRDFVPKSGPAVLSCELLKASCTVKSLCSCGSCQSWNSPPIPTCPCTSWAWSPPMSFSPSALLLPEHPATLGVLGCRTSILFIIKYFCSVDIWFFSSSTLSHLSLVSFLRLISSLLIKAWQALFSFTPKWFYLLLPQFFLESFSSLLLHCSVSQAMMD